MPAVVATGWDWPPVSCGPGIAGREEDWLPQALAASDNRHLQLEGDGYFAIAAQVPLLDRHGNALARAITTVPANSNVQVDPALIARAGHALADRLAALYPEYAANFRDHARDFAQLVAMHRERWAPRRPSTLRRQAVRAPAGNTCTTDGTCMNRSQP